MVHYRCSVFYASRDKCLFSFKRVRVDMRERERERERERRPLSGWKIEHKKATSFDRGAIISQWKIDNDMQFARMIARQHENTFFSLCSYVKISSCMKGRDSSNRERDENRCLNELDRFSDPSRICLFRVRWKDDLKKFAQHMYIFFVQIAWLFLDLTDTYFIKFGTKYSCNFLWILQHLLTQVPSIIISIRNWSDIKNHYWN